MHLLLCLEPCQLHSTRALTHHSQQSKAGHKPRGLVRPLDGYPVGDTLTASRPVTLQTATH